MVSPLLPVLVIVAIAVAVAVARRPASGSPRSVSEPRSTAVVRCPATTDLAAALDRAVASGLITADTAAAIRAQEGAEAVTIDAGSRPAVATPEPRRSRIPATAEALGYVGAAVLILGLISLISSAWPDMPFAARTAVLAATVLVLFGVGTTLDDDEPIEWRLRSVVWGLSIGAAAGLAAHVVVDGFGWTEEAVAVATGSVAALYGVALWRLKDRPTCQVGTFVGIVVAMIGVTSWLDGSPAMGLAVMAVGVLWLALARLDKVPPRYAGVVLGCAALLMGPGITSESWSTAAPLIGLVVGAGLVAMGAVRAGLLVTAAGVIGVIVYLPWSLSELFGDAVGPAVIQVVTGAALLGAMVVLLRYRHRNGAEV